MCHQLHPFLFVKKVFQSGLYHNKAKRVRQTILARIYSNICYLVYIFLLSGDSSGGNLAAAVDGELAKENLKLTGTILIYPWVQVATMGLPSQHSKVFCVKRS